MNIDNWIDIQTLASSENQPLPMAFNIVLNRNSDFLIKSKEIKRKERRLVIQRSV
jgi:hypothetical protein